MQQPTHLDLFSGIGGFALAAKWAGFHTVAFCEIDPYCQKVLAKNFSAIPDSMCGGFDGRDNLRSGHVSPNEERTAAQNESQRSGRISGISEACEARIHSNIFDFDGTAYRGCDLLTGGFPCQPFSVAGKQRGAEDDRHLWPQMLRVISEARPAWVLGENVPGIIPMELDGVLSSLEGIDYACRPFVIPACAVDARHRRDRVWIVGKAQTVANPEKIRCRQGDTNTGRCGKGTGAPTQWRRSADSGKGKPQSEFCGMVDGLSQKLDEPWRWPDEAPETPRVAQGVKDCVARLRGLGNAIVPQCAYEILRVIYSEIQNEKVQ